MQADWLEKFYADDTYLDFGKAMRGGYNTPQINTLIQKANAQQMPCIIPSSPQGADGILWPGAKRAQSR